MAPKGHTALKPTCVSMGPKPQAFQGMNDPTQKQHDVSRQCDFWIIHVATALIASLDQPGFHQSV